MGAQQGDRMAATPGKSRNNPCETIPKPIRDPFPTPEDLVQTAKSKILDNKEWQKALKDKKEKLLKIVEENVRSQTGDEEFEIAPFANEHEPPTTVEGWAERDFTIDLKKDMLDEYLEVIGNELLGLFLQVTPVENRRKIFALESHNEALVERMITLEHHLNNRSMMLSKCRYAYYLELTHLRNQLYFRDQEGEGYEVIHAQYFDITDYIEEELREQLNTKIRDSVFEYHEKLKKLQALYDEMARELKKMTSGGSVNVISALQQLVQSHGSYEVVSSMASANVAKGDMEEWAHNVMQKEIQYAVDEAVEAEALMWQQKLAAKEEENQNAIRDLQNQIANLQAELEKQIQETQSANERASSHTSTAPAVSAGLYEADQMRLDSALEDKDRLERKIKELEEEIESLRAALKEKEEEEPDESVAASSEELPPPMTLAERRRSSVSGSREEMAAAIEQYAKDLEDAMAEIERLRATIEELKAAIVLHEEEKEKYKSELERLASEQASRTSERRRSTKGQIPEGLGTTDTSLFVSEEDLMTLLQPLSSEAQSLMDCAQAAQAEKPDGFLSGNAKAADKAAAVSTDKASDEQDGDDDVEVSEEVTNQISLIKEAMISGKDALGIIDLYKLQLAEVTALMNEFQSECLHLKHTLAKKEQAEREAVPRTMGLGGPESGAQTIVTGCEGGFYLLEYPISDGQLCCELELEDLNACANANWETSLEKIRTSRRPPLGYGLGFCKPNAFRRLFLGAVCRLQRQEDLRSTLKELEKTELERLCDGIHYLQESSMPDYMPELRDLIFGKGFSKANMLEKADFPNEQEFLQLQKTWIRNVRGVLEVLECHPQDVELGVHHQRRTFLPGGAGGGGRKASLSRDVAHDHEVTTSYQHFDGISINTNVGRFPNLLEEQHRLRARGQSISMRRSSYMHNHNQNTNIKQNSHPATAHASFMDNSLSSDVGCVFKDSEFTLGEQHSLTTGGEPSFTTGQGPLSGEEFAFGGGGPSSANHGRGSVNHFPMPGDLGGVGMAIAGLMPVSGASRPQSQQRQRSEHSPPPPIGGAHRPSYHPTAQKLVTPSPSSGIHLFGSNGGVGGGGGGGAHNGAGSPTFGDDEGGAPVQRVMQDVVVLHPRLSQQGAPLRSAHSGRKLGDKMTMSRPDFLHELPARPHTSEGTSRASVLGPRTLLTGKTSRTRPMTGNSIARGSNYRNSTSTSTSNAALCLSSVAPAGVPSTSTSANAAAAAAAAQTRWSTSSSSFPFIDVDGESAGGAHNLSAQKKNMQSHSSGASPPHGGFGSSPPPKTPPVTDTVSKALFESPRGLTRPRSRGTVSGSSEITGSYFHKAKAKAAAAAASSSSHPLNSTSNSHLLNSTSNSHLQIRVRSGEPYAIYCVVDNDPCAVPSKLHIGERDETVYDFHRSRPSSGKMVLHENNEQDRPHTSSSEGGTMKLPRTVSTPALFGKGPLPIKASDPDWAKKHLLESSSAQEPIPSWEYEEQQERTRAGRSMGGAYTKAHALVGVPIKSRGNEPKASSAGAGDSRYAKSSNSGVLPPYQR